MKKADRNKTSLDLVLWSCRPHRCVPSHDTQGCDPTGSEYSTAVPANKNTRLSYTNIYILPPLTRPLVTLLLVNKHK